MPAQTAGSTGLWTAPAHTNEAPASCNRQTWSRDGNIDAQLQVASGWLEDRCMPTGTSISPAARIRGFTYAIRNIVAEAKKVEAAGRKVRYLNIGDPIPFGFVTPPHLVEAVSRAMHDGHNGYTASPGIQPARQAVADEYERRGMPVGVDRVILTSGTSE